MSENEKKYQIAIYIRLSKEDEKLKEESNSITMQRILLQNYISENFANYQLLEFCDDGYTGTNLNRPAMQKMLEQIRNGEINCVVVKDFSRFARDYLALGSYLEQIFPSLDIRFISINDNYDSIQYQGSIADIDVNFKNLLYDLYSKDLSNKVSSSLAIKKEKGQYVSGNSPFGYEKDPSDRHALLIAKDEAKIVRQIFSFTLEGYTSVEIARMFNEARVKTPIEFKIEKGKTSRTPKGERFLWNSSTICQILRNEIYIGNIVQKKYTKDFVSGKSCLNPCQDWLITYNHHEPIIDKAVFEKVQEGRGKKKKHSHLLAHPLVGKLVCGRCKKNLRYREGLNPYFSCYQRYSNAMKGCVCKVSVVFLEQYILLKIQEKLQADGELEKVRIEKIHSLEKMLKEEKEKRKFLTMKLKKLKQQNFETYQNYVNGKRNSFQSNELVVKSLEKELANLNDSLQKMETAYFDINHNKEKKCVEIPIVVLTKEIIEQYINKIEIFDEQHITIQWR